MRLEATVGAVFGNGASTATVVIGAVPDPLDGPEPAGWAMLLFGLGAVARAGRRGRAG